MVKTPPTPEISPGLSRSFRYEVTEDDTALAVGSGDVPVLATPRILALAENATVQAVAAALAPGQTTVGTRVSLNHLSTSLPGSEVEVRAELIDVQGRQLTFAVVIGASTGNLLARGQVTRVLVDRDTFIAKAHQPPPASPL